jgi:leader peptidase (prepilin peptidase) / N-methyltransferase
MPFPFSLWFDIGAFILGSIFGSFANVCIFRIPLEQSIAFPPSHCPSCGTSIAWYDNIPVFSYLILLRGKCRHCKTHISFQYPLIELACGILSLLCFRIYGPTPAFLIYTVLLLAMVIISLIDLRHYIIPNVIVIPGALIGFGLSFYLSRAIPGATTPLESAIGAIAGAGFLWGFALLYKALTGREGMGFGDVKLMLMIGAFTGPIGVVETIMLGSIVGTVIGSLFLLLTKKERHFQIPFGPFLGLGLFHYVFFGHGLARLYLNYAHLLIF